MGIDERLKTLEDEFQTTKEELRQILLDIRTYLMEMQTPFRTDSNTGGLTAQNNSEKVVEPNGNGQER